MVLWVERPNNTEDCFLQCLPVCIFVLAVRPFLHLSKLAYVWRLSSDPNCSVNRYLITLVHNDLTYLRSRPRVHRLCWVCQRHICPGPTQDLLTHNPQGGDQASLLVWHQLVGWYGSTFENHSSLPRIWVQAYSLPCNNLSLPRVFNYFKSRILSLCPLTAWRFIGLLLFAGHCSRWWQYRDE